MVFRHLYNSKVVAKEALSMYKKHVENVESVSKRVVEEFSKDVIRPPWQLTKGFLKQRLKEKEQEVYTRKVTSGDVETFQHHMINEDTKFPSTPCKYDINGWPANIAALRATNVRTRATLIICPVSLVGQWEAEIIEKLKDKKKVSIYKYYGRNRKLSGSALSGYDFVLSTYETLGKDMSTYAPSACPDIRPPLLQLNWFRIIFDESHRIAKGAWETKAALALCSKRRWMVTGTPFQDHVSSISTQCRCLGLLELGYKSLWNDMMSDDLNTAACNALLRRIMIRHSNAMTYQRTGLSLSNLPGKVEEQVNISMPAQELKSYKRLEEKCKESFSPMCLGGVSYDDRFKKLIRSLQKACSGVGPSNTQSVCEDNDDGDELNHLIKARGGKNSSSAAAHNLKCAKLTWLMDKLREIRDNSSPTSKVLIFSQFTSTFRRIIGPLMKLGYQFRTLTCNMKEPERTKALSDFRNDPPTTIFLLSMRAGAVGLNLTEANHVILMEPCMNKQLEYQAVGRVHRLGQRREVKVYRPICLGTVEERITEMHSSSGDIVSDKSTAGALKKADRVTISEAHSRFLLGLPPEKEAATTTITTATTEEGVDTAAKALEQEDLMLSSDSGSPTTEEEEEEAAAAAENSSSSSQLLLPLLPSEQCIISVPLLLSPHRGSSSSSSSARIQQVNLPSSLEEGEKKTKKRPRRSPTTTTRSTRPLRHTATQSFDQTPATDLEDTEGDLEELSDTNPMMYWHSNSSSPGEESPSLQPPWTALSRREGEPIIVDEQDEEDDGLYWGPIEEEEEE